MRPLLGYFALAALMFLAACAQGPGDATPAVAVSRNPDTAWHAQTMVFLTPDGPAEGQTVAHFRGDGASRITVALMVQGRSRLRLNAVCDGPARMITRPVGGTEIEHAWVAPGAALPLELAPGERRRTFLDLGAAVQHCAMTVTPGGRPSYRLDLQREETARPRLAAFDAPLPDCRGFNGGDALAQAFAAQGRLAATCPVPVGPVHLLGDGSDALNARITALTGRPAPRAALAAGDPDMALDWSAAPDLDLIYVNYLNLNADFTGYLMARMLAWHAARGTVVRILVSELMQSGTDRRLFEGLAARYPTIQIQAFRFPAEAARGIEGQLGRIHRATHVKLFATVARQPGQSVAIVGGRNIHDGYFATAPHDLTQWPDLRQYNPDPTRLFGGLTAFDDFEIAVHGAAARQIARHMAALWHRDHDSQTPRPPGPGQGARPVGDGVMRHFISVPYADGQAQEDWFIGLIDAARLRIDIVAPYINLTPGLEAALLRARDRGVAVRVVGTLHVDEITAPIVGGLNLEFAQTHGDWIEFLDLPVDPAMLHAKIYVIDRRLAIIGSTNLNQRSFVHDLENGVAILDRSTARRIEAVIERYAARAGTAPPGQTVPGFVRWLRRTPLFGRAF